MGYSLLLFFIVYNGDNLCCVVGEPIDTDSVTLLNINM